MSHFNSNGARVGYSAPSPFKGGRIFIPLGLSWSFFWDWWNNVCAVNVIPQKTETLLDFDSLRMVTSSGECPNCSNWNFKEVKEMTDKGERDLKKCEHCGELLKPRFISRRYL
ncbi:MAG: hypothetical protein PHW01_02425 [Patescibacteria group bacterium]|nr:hypothetical protein [Patescibacteria group bacterium]